jgi:hypothetical protein
MDEIPKRLYQCGLCGEQVTTDNVLISGIPHCKKDNKIGKFNFIKII